MTARSLPSTAWARFKESVGQALLKRVRPTLDNWRSALRLFPMLVLSWRYFPVGGQRSWWGYFVGQLGKEMGRSLIPIIALGMGFGLGVGSVTGGPGSLVGIALGTVDALPTILQRAVPLALAVFFAARTGGPLAAKFARAVHEAGGRWGPRNLAWDAWPHLLVAPIVGVLAYVITAEFLVRGYEAAGELSTFWALDGPKLLGWNEHLGLAIATTAIFSYVVSHIAIAYGAAQGVALATGRRYQEDAPDHYVIWDSFRASVVVAFVLTAILP